MNYEPLYLNASFELDSVYDFPANQMSSDRRNGTRYQTVSTTNVGNSGFDFPVSLPIQPSPFAGCDFASMVGNQTPTVYPSISPQQVSNPYIPSESSRQSIFYPHTQPHYHALESASHFQSSLPGYDDKRMLHAAYNALPHNLSQEPSFPQIPSPKDTMDLLARDINGVDWAHVEFLCALQQACDGADYRVTSTHPPQRPNIPDVQNFPFDSQSWNEILFTMDSSDSVVSSPAGTLPLNEFPFSLQYEMSPFTSPSPSPSPSRDLPRRESPLSSTASTPAASRRGSVDLSSTGVKKCSHCRATSTPLWRREPTTLRPLCNACGLYLQQRNKLRPQELIDADADDDECLSTENLTGPECSHCHTRQTSVWRRSKAGAQLCNACGVYSRLRGKDRPLSLKRNKIKPRSKHTK